MIAQLFNVANDTQIKLNLYTGSISAGRGFEPDDYYEKLDLNEHLITNPAASFFVRVACDSMIDAGIFQDDLLLVDKSLDHQSGKIVIAALNGEFTLKRYVLYKGLTFLVPENKKYKAHQIKESDDFYIWGVVKAVIKRF
jgi:DNA polymerase V